MTQHTNAIASQVKRVVLVGGGPEVLAYAEPLLPPGAYQVAFVENYEAPYAVIRTERPELVLLCLRLEDEEAFQLLSMLRLDPATRHIPVLTYTTQFEGQRFEGVDEGEPAGRGAATGHGITLARH